MARSFRSGRYVPRRLTERAYKGPSRGEKRVLLSCYFGPSKANRSPVRYHRIMPLLSSPQRVQAVVEAPRSQEFVLSEFYFRLLACFTLDQGNPAFGPGEYLSPRADLQTRG